MSQTIKYAKVRAKQDPDYRMDVTPCGIYVGYNMPFKPTTYWTKNVRHTHGSVVK